MKEDEKRTENNRIKRSARIYSDIHSSFTVIGLVISVSDEWQEMGDKTIDKL